MELKYRWIEGRFLKRPNRFIAHVEFGGETLIAHVPNTGRLKELLVPGALVRLSDHEGADRKTRYELRMVQAGEHWVSIDSQLPNRIVADGLSDGTICDFGIIKGLRREVIYGNSRFDLLLDTEPETYVEVKGVTLIRDDWSFFPDAPTERGARHVRELMDAIQNGYNAGIVFLVQHPAARGFTPNGQTDPAFAKAIAEAVQVGVQVVAWKCNVTSDSVSLWERIPVVLWEDSPGEKTDDHPPRQGG